MAIDKAKARVVVLGGGFAGLESAFLIRKLVGDKASITIVSDKDFFYFRPNTIYIPFGLDPRQVMIPIKPACTKKNIDFINDTVGNVDFENKRVSVGDNEIGYDYAILATGSGLRPEEIPGLEDHATCIWKTEDLLKLERQFNEVSSKALQGNKSSVVFLVPQGNKCAGPLYEIVLMLDTWLRKQGSRNNVDISFATYEHDYLQVFGAGFNYLIEKEFENRAISGIKEQCVESIDKETIHFSSKASMTYSLLVSFPPYVAAVDYPGLPKEDRKFIKTDLGTRQVAGVDHVYAPGDGGDYPVKQAFLAFLQGDATASQIAGAILNKTPEIYYDPVSMCIMEHLDKATFAQIPLSLAEGGPSPVVLREETLELYRIGTGKTWQMGKKLLGVYARWRIGNGEPFHAGVPWQVMEKALNVMTIVLTKNGLHGVDD